MTHTLPIIAPELEDALYGLEKRIIEHQLPIEAWLRQQWQKTPAPVTCSVDLRNGGFKVAPIDTNLYPAGFNNLHEGFMPLCSHAAQTIMEKLCDQAVSILIIPESHTRNPHYFASLARLQDIFTKAGIVSRIGSLLALDAPKVIELENGKHITLEPITRQGDTIRVADFEPCFILLNNDLSDGVPDILKKSKQPIYPALYLGWSKRLKSIHFTYYNDVANEFSQIIDIDPWLINPLFRNCGEVDFMKREGERCLTINTTHLLKSIKEKYEQYGIKKKPYIMVKADSGTYGMGIMRIDDPEQLQQLNRKQRTRMASSKGGKTITKVILQEGVHTFETIGKNNTTAEPVIYMIGHHVVGGFYRTHEERGIDENLNAPGMKFIPIDHATWCNDPNSVATTETLQNRFYLYSVVARLALLAAAREISECNYDD